MKTADEIYFSGMFTIARVETEEIELGAALERAGMILVSRNEWESMCDSLAISASGNRGSDRQRTQ